MKILKTGEAIQRAGEGVKLTTFIPIRIKKRGGRKLVLPAKGAPMAKRPKHNSQILTALSRAFHWQRLLDEGRVGSAAEIARQEGLHPTTIGDVLRLNLLAPVVVQAILAGRHPPSLRLLWLKNNPLPLDWQEQQALFDGFDA